MRTWQLLDAETRWQRFCLQELRGIQKLKRRSRPGGQPGLSPRARGVPEGARGGAGALPGLQAPCPAARRCPGPLFPAAAAAAEAAEASAGAPASPARLLEGGPGEGHPEGSSASPGPRPSDPAAASELQALQQTRRLLANARERSRVHTISAAFEALRKQVPCYSYGQKLSKLAILRIACNYILSLARLADLDYSVDRSNMSFSECVEQCTRTLQAEGRSKKRKE